MTWFLLALATILLWGIADVLHKASLDPNDPVSHYKNFVWTGIIMALAGYIMSTWSETLLDSVKMVAGDVLYLIPLCFVYAAAMLLSLLGTKHLAVSVVTLLENINGALIAIIIYYYYLLTGYIHPSYTFGVVDFIATGVIIVGVIMLGRQEQALFRQEMLRGEEKKKHRFGALALFFPLLYALIDVFSIAEISGVSGNSGIVAVGTEDAIPAIDFFIFECAGFAVASLCIWLYLAIVKKCIYNPFQPEEMVRCGAAMGETFGTMTFIFAAAVNPVLTGPVTSLYCFVTILLARIFLKERLTKKQYVSMAFLAAGIILMGISEIISVK